MNIKEELVQLHNVVAALVGRVDKLDGGGQKAEEPKEAEGEPGVAEGAAGGIASTEGAIPAAEALGILSDATPVKQEDTTPGAPDETFVDEAPPLETHNVTVDAPTAPDGHPEPVAAPDPEPRPDAALAVQHSTLEDAGVLAEGDTGPEADGGESEPAPAAEAPAEHQPAGHAPPEEVVAAEAEGGQAVEENADAIAAEVEESPDPVVSGVAKKRRKG